MWPPTRGYPKYKQQRCEMILPHSQQHQLSFSLQKEPGNCPACNIQHRAACKIPCETFSGGKMSFGESVVSNISSIPVEFNHHSGKMFFDRSFRNWQDGLQAWASSEIVHISEQPSEVSAQLRDHGSSGFRYPHVSLESFFWDAEKQLLL